MAQIYYMLSLLTSAKQTGTMTSKPTGSHVSVVVDTSDM